MAAPPPWAAGEDDKMTMDGLEGKGDVPDTRGNGWSAKFADSLDQREGGESDSGWPAQQPEAELVHACILLELGPVGEAGARGGAGERLCTTGHEARCPLAQDGDAVRCGIMECKLPDHSGGGAGAAQDAPQGGSGGSEVHAARAEVPRRAGSDEAPGRSGSDWEVRSTSRAETVRAGDDAMEARCTRRGGAGAGDEATDGRPAAPQHGAVLREESRHSASHHWKRCSPEELLQRRLRKAGGLREAGARAGGVVQAATAATARAPAPAVARAIASMPASAPSLVPAVLELLTTQRVLLGRLQEEAERQSEWRQAVEAREAASWEARQLAEARRRRRARQDAAAIVLQAAARRLASVRTRRFRERQLAARRRLAAREAEVRAQQRRCRARTAAERELAAAMTVRPGTMAGDRPGHQQEAAAFVLQACAGVEAEAVTPEGGSRARQLNLATPTAPRRRRLIFSPVEADGLSEEAAGLSEEAAATRLQAGARRLAATRKRGLLARRRAAALRLQAREAEVQRWRQLQLARRVEAAERATARAVARAVARVVEAEEPVWLREAAERVEASRGAPLMVAQGVVTIAAEAVVMEAAGAAEVLETTTTAGPRPLELAAIVAAAEAAMTETDAEEALLARSIGDAQREDRARLKAVLDESKSVARAQSRSLGESLAQAAATVTPEARLGAGARRLEALVAGRKGSPYPLEGTHQAAGMGWREQVERNLEISRARHRLR